MPLSRVISLLTSIPEKNMVALPRTACTASLVALWIFTVSISIGLAFSSTATAATRPGTPIAGAVPAARGMALTVKEARQLQTERGKVPNDRIAEAFLRLPYRVDGALNEKAEYTLFADQSKRFETPGLNCSGLVLALSRFLLDKNIPLETVMRDRLGDSGPGAPDGEDWDFGWDLIMNISEGMPRRFLLPGSKVMDPANATGYNTRGYDIQSAATWAELTGRMQPGHLYLISLNMVGRRQGYGLQHYHVGLVYMASTGEAWFYQTTGKGKGVNRRDLKTTAGQASFRKAFANTKGVRKQMTVLEVDLPR